MRVFIYFILIVSSFALLSAGQRYSPLPTSIAAARPISVSVFTCTPIAAGKGELRIDSVPQGADIEVDGSFVGNTPSTVQLTEGDHMVVLRKGGYKKWEGTVKVSAGNSVRVSAELEKNAIE